MIWNVYVRGPVRVLVAARDIEMSKALEAKGYEVDSGFEADDEEEAAAIAEALIDVRADKKGKKRG